MGELVTKLYAIVNGILSEIIRRRVAAAKARALSRRAA
jgi:hypothetical protein